MVLRGVGLSSPHFVVGAVAVAVGVGSFIIDSLSWYDSQNVISLYSQTSVLEKVGWFYLTEGFAVLAVIGGLYLVYRSLSRAADRSESLTTISLVSEALSSKKSFRFGVAGALIYGFVYAVVSGVVVYQPSVDFAQAYGVTSAGWNAAACCGAWGTVPTAVFYVSPGAHFALQLLPLNTFFAFVVPILVGMNIALATYAIGRGLNAKWIGSIGAIVGLFTGCPTCAALFFAGTVGGVGATTIAVALAPYQLLFIVVSIPLLLASPFLMAGTLRRSNYAACRVPGATPALQRP